jgi:uncharacterized protein
MTLLAPALIAAVLRGYRLHLAGLHGPGHWLRVLANGRVLARNTPGADREVVELFVLLHDCCRENDGRDSQHGERAAFLATALCDAGQLALPPPRRDLLAAACARHEHGGTSPDPTIGCCWDADRLDLSRIGRRPLDALLSTAASRDPALRHAAWERGIDEEIDAALAGEWRLDPRVLRGDGAG